MKILDILTEADEWYGQDFYAISKKENERFEKDIQDWFSQLKGKRFSDDYRNIFEITNISVNMSPRYMDTQKSEVVIGLRVSYNFYDTKIPPTLYTEPLKLFVERFRDFIKSKNIDLTHYDFEIQLKSSKIYFTFKDITMNNSDSLSDYLESSNQLFATVTNIDNPESEIQSKILSKPPEISYGDFQNTDALTKKGLTIFNAHSKGTVTVKIYEKDYKVNYTLSNPEFYYGARPKTNNFTIGIDKIEKYITCELNVDIKDTSNHRYLMSEVAEKLYKMFDKFKIYLRIRPSY
jgi:hypothetical protein